MSLTRPSTSFAPAPTGQFPALSPLAATEPANLEWKDQGPRSRAFGDLYFSRENGHAETEHVFIAGNRLPERFRHWHQPRPFVIGETGFGTGLNMLCAWAAFERHAPAHARLHLVSTEKYPLSRHDLARALGAWPSLEAYAGVLCRQWPSAVLGVHRLHLDNRVTLDLHLGDACHRLGLLDGKVDAWFLDGFSPATNPDMWHPGLFETLAARSRPGASFATFTCAGIVKRGLSQAGFQWKKVPGFGRKREMLCGHLDTPPADHRRQKTPWFIPPAPRPVREVAVIGAGIAGTSIAAALARRGIKVRLIDRQGIAAGASGNRQGALYIKLAANTNDQSRLYLSGLNYSRRWLEWLDPEQRFWAPSGVLQLAFNDAEQGRQQGFINGQALPTDQIRQVDGKSHSGLAANHPSDITALYYPQAGWVRPADLCHALANHPAIEVITAKVEALTATEQGWQVTLKGTGALTNTSTRMSTNALDVDQVVIANATAANALGPTACLPLQAVRGQVSELDLPPGIEGPDQVVCAGGYVPPATRGRLTFGASFVPNSTDTEVRGEDHEHNIAELSRCLPRLADALKAQGLTAGSEQIQGRVSIRAASPDKSPYAGPVANAADWRRDYAVLGKDASRVPDRPGRYHPGLWISVGHGSRGLSSAPLCAEVVASRICDEPMPLEGPLIDHLHPGRRLIKALIRGR